MTKFFQPSDQLCVTQPHRLARLPVRQAVALEAPLTPAQREALEASQAAAAKYPLRPVQQAAVDEAKACKGFFAGWRVP